MLTCYEATSADIADIVELVNTCYRGDSSRLGWTSEADWVAGLRTDANHTAQLITSPDSTILVARHGCALLGSILLEYLASHQAAAIGMFAVKPTQQNQGIGKQLLAYAEQFAGQHWSVHRLEMHVIPWRHELIAFYRRRGYRATGDSQPFPEHPELWRPKQPGLTLITLEKIIQDASF